MHSESPPLRIAPELPNCPVAVPRPRHLLARLPHWIIAWWKQRLIPPESTLRYLVRKHELSDHILRDIGFLDSLPPGDDKRIHTDY
jgi:uncharacterized protein YjiS (DUF1127 family)